ncbi:NosD domain-containing protein [Bacillus spongiae]|uniref:NosD domain-containing protein n=1 Tax=Bacillus spongiae TaxID=2683610 RepID=A0ABU8HC59_9BACI
MAIFTVPSIPTPTVQDAITLADPGDTIEILVGTFDGFTVDKDRLKIVGCGIGKTKISGAGVGNDGVVVTGNQTHLIGFTVQGFGTGIGVSVQSSNNVIQKVEASFNSNGFTINGQDNLLTMNSATFNQIDGFRVTDEFNCFEKNQSTNNTNGYHFFDPNNMSVDNLAKNNSGAGFLLNEGGSDNMIVGNTVVKNDIGIDCQTDDNSINENKVCDNTTIGIGLIGESGNPNGNLVDWNTVRNNGTELGMNHAGIFVSDGSGATTENSIRFNKANNNIEYDILAEGGTGFNFYDGNICDNSDPVSICTP